MNCPSCGRYGPPDPQTGYDGDDLCLECKEAEMKIHAHICEHCDKEYECDGRNCGTIYAFSDDIFLCENCQEREWEQRQERKML